MASTSAARLSMSRWLVGSSRTTRWGPSSVASPSNSRAFSPPESCAAEVSAIAAGKPIAPAVRPHLGLGRVRQQSPDVVIGAGARIEFIELMLGEVGDFDAVGARHRPGQRREAAGQQLGQRRLAVAVGAEQSNAVIGVDPQRQALEHGARRLIADGHVRKCEDGRRQRLFGRCNRDLAVIGLGAHIDRLKLRQHFEAGLRLARLRCLGAEPVDEGGKPRALGFLLLRASAASRASRSLRWRSKDWSSCRDSK